MLYYAVHDGNYDYIKSVESRDEYEANYGHIHPDYQPRVRSFETREEAEEYMREQNKRARAYYGGRNV